MPVYLPASVVKLQGDVVENLVVSVSLVVGLKLFNTLQMFQIRVSVSGRRESTVRPDSCHPFINAAINLTIFRPSNYPI